MSVSEGMEDEPGSPGPPPLEDQNGMEVTAPVQKSAKAIQGEVRQRWVKQRERRRLDLTALNPYIVCALCKGYLIDPVSVVECLHSFCKSCIVKHVETSRTCPTCNTQIHLTKPLLSLRADAALQDIVYKVVPGLFRAEMNNRAKFYSNHPEAEPLNPEDAGQISDRLFFSPEDEISMSIEYFDSYSGTEEMKRRSVDQDQDNQNRRFLQCPGSVTVAHIKKLIMTKYGLDQTFLVDVIYKEDLLPEDQTLIDVAYSYNWRKTSPMQFFYRIYQKTKVLTRKRKKKRTKTGGKSQPAKKRRHVDTAWNAAAESGGETAMEVDAEASPPKLASKPEKTRSDKAAKHKLSVSPRSDKKPRLEASVKASQPLSPNPVAAKKGEKPAPPVSKPATLPQANKPATIPAASKAATLPPVSKAATLSTGNKSAILSSASKPATLSSASKPATFSSANKSATLSSASKPATVPPINKTATSVPVSKAASVPVSTAAAAGLSRGVSSGTGHKTAATKQATVLAAPPHVKKPDTKSPVPAVKAAGPGRNLTNGVVTPTKPTLAKASSKVVPKEKLGLTSKPESKPERVNQNGLKTAAMPAAAKKAEPAKATVPRDKSPNRLVIAEKKKPTTVSGSEKKKEVVEISVEVSASDVKKVLEKKRAEKDAKLLTSSGEEKLYSNYSIVDQIKKAGSSAAANLARQQTERASMMDFARTSDALTAPKVPPTIQGLQPKVSSGSETNVLSAIVQNLAQKQQKLQTSVSSAGTPTTIPKDPPTVSYSPVLAGPKSLDALVSEAKGNKASDAAKTLGTMVAPSLSTSLLEKPAQPKADTLGPKLPVSTSIKPILKPDGKQGPTAVETGGVKGQQVLNLYKNSFSKPVGSLTDAAKSAESLTKNIPAGTTVTVKTVENSKSNGKPSAVASSPGTLATSPKHSAFKSNISNANVQTSKMMSPFSSVAPVTTPPLINPFVHNTLQANMTMALAAQQAQYLNQGFGGAAAAALAAQMEAANNYAANIVRAAQVAAQISQTPLTTVAFTKPSLSPAATGDEARFGLKIPTPSLSRHQSPSVSSFGTSRLQVKVNSDGPLPGSPTSRAGKSPSPPTSAPTNDLGALAAVTSSGKTTGTHSMPAILPFHSVKKVQPLPKTASQSPRPASIASILKNDAGRTSKSPPTSLAAVSKPSLPTSVSNPAVTSPFKPGGGVVPPKSTVGGGGLEPLKKAPTPPATAAPTINPLKPATPAQVNSLKKLAADLNTVHQKTLKGDNNILSSLKKSSENKLCGGDIKSLGKEVGKPEVGKEVKTS